MDLNETARELISRHPWELSRTGCILKAIGKYIDKCHEKKDACRYINVGAGDLYFDAALMSKYEKDEVYAVDIGYEENDPGEERIHKSRYLENVTADKVDYALMMDSLEYMENDAEYIRSLSANLVWGGISSLHCRHTRLCFRNTTGLSAIFADMIPNPLRKF